MQPILKFAASVWNTKYAPISRGAESAWWCVQFNEIRKVKRSSASDHAVADCSNLVYYSTFFWQPVQIHKRIGVAGGRGVTCSRLETLQTRRAVQCVSLQVHYFVLLTTVCVCVSYHIVRVYYWTQSVCICIRMLAPRWDLTYVVQCLLTGAVFIGALRPKVRSALSCQPPLPLRQRGSSSLPPRVDWNAVSDTSR